MIAAGATLCTEQSTPVNPSPSFHSALELMVISGRAAWERGVENRFFFVEKKIKQSLALVRGQKRFTTPTILSSA